jgi:hypothetical protein
VTAACARAASTALTPLAVERGRDRHDPGDRRRPRARGGRESLGRLLAGDLDNVVLRAL